MQNNNTHYGNGANHIFCGFPSPLIEMQMEYCAAVKEGRVDIVTNDIEHLLDRSPRS